MKCPACYSKLRPVQVGTLQVDVCDGCGGIWFDAFELSRADEENEAAGQPLLHLKHDPKVVVDPARKRECPRCEGVKLHRHYYSAKRRFQVDECPNCAGYWLDRGELAAMRAENTSETEIQKAREAVVSFETIRYLYSVRVSGKTPQAER